MVIAGFLFRRLFGFVLTLSFFSFLHLMYLCRTLLKAGRMDFACGLVPDPVF